MSEEKKPIDPNMTLEVNNDQLENLLVRYNSEKSAESLNALVSHFHVCRVLVPANLNDKKQPVPCLIKNNDGKLFMAIYTSKKQIPETPKSPAIMNLPYTAVNQMAAAPQMGVEGIVINPFSNNLVFKKELIQKIFEIDQSEKKAPQMKEIKMSPQQYVVFERKQFELRFLPKKFFDDGQAFVDELCEKKEEYIDALYEESYQQKRVYPYLPEEFSVMIINITEDTRIIRVDMPTRDLEDGGCSRVFLVWNEIEQTCRYFTIEKAGKESILAEVTTDWKHVNLGQAPAEGSELSSIMDILEGK